MIAYKLNISNKTILDYLLKHEYVYRELATKCSSVSELQVKLALFGNNWTKWEWGVFFFYLIVNSVENEIKNEEDDLNLFSEILNTIQTTNILDSILSDKVIVMLLIECAKKKFSTYQNACKILSYIFQKFPDLWNMNWMLIKHQYKTKQKKMIRYTHRLEHCIKDKTNINVEQFIKEHIK